MVAGQCVVQYDDKMLGAQELPCGGQLVFCNLLIFSCSYVVCRYQ